MQLVEIFAYVFGIMGLSFGVTVCLLTSIGLMKEKSK